jgi:hypothetical protein
MYVFKYIVAIKELYYQLKLMYLFLRHVVNKPKTFERNLEGRVMQ